ncbi:MAG: oxygen-dependent coproporphyrinogen oxidase [Microscillaceae bacterium]|nr:oxygen-dependent coproporphyrinogen oxidase [Microscillaceae bacterium]MDW8461718.1 oxygen-dependent coproporphyrinogen oxidase [Cytophagales bacterium]
MQALATPSKEQITNYFQDLQNRICHAIEQADRKGKFLTDTWQRLEGGGGISRIIQQGQVLEKAGVNFSAVFGEIPEALRTHFQFQGEKFYATGVSIVMHPHNPFVPIIHMNVRYFQLDEHTAWFGGGIDLTPHYIDEEEARFFHQSLKNICDKYHTNYYATFKKWADDYFFIKHRQETRGIGGIFFDRLKADSEFSLYDRFLFVQEVAEAFVPIYTHLIAKNKNRPFTEQHKRWQLLRRGRYVEFNLVYDAGTKFGLETNGRIESILMSLPPYVSWEYNYVPQSGSAEEKTLKLLKKGIEWV